MTKVGHWLPLPKDEQEYIEAREWRCVYIIKYDSMFVRSYCFFCKNFHMLKIGYEVLGVPVGVGKLAKLFCKSTECPIDYGRDQQHEGKPQPHYILEEDKTEEYTEETI